MIPSRRCAASVALGAIRGRLRRYADFGLTIRGFKMSNFAIVKGRFFLKRPGDENSKGFVPCFLFPAEVSSEGRRLIREGADVGFFAAYVPAAMMPDTISRNVPYEVEAELILERAPWEHVERGGKIRITYINNHYLLVRSMVLVADAIAAISPAAAVSLGDEGGTFGDIPPLGSGKGGKK